MTLHWNYLALWLLCIVGALQPIKSSEYIGRPFPRHDKWSQAIKGDYIPMQFYEAMRSAEDSKQAFQNQLRNFKEHLQRNLTMSNVLSLGHENQLNTQHQRTKLHELSEFFYAAADAARIFARDSETSYEVAKNSSYTLLLQLRQIPSTQPIPVKMHLTNYFAEMEFFHIMFSEIIDEALEYTQNILLATQKTFTYYADVQRFVLQNWNFKGDVGCCQEYMEFLKHYSDQIFKCAAGRGLNVAFDVFAMTELTSKYIMRQLEFRIQRLFNCLYLGSYEIRCKFLLNAEKDFEMLFTKIEELEIFYDLRMKNGRVSALRQRRQNHIEEAAPTGVKALDNCIPLDFPRSQMHKSLKQCFYSITEY
ncbi:PREDICTED: uncharacterized protein LOC108621750 [Drosophila arizonae]|uniref:Uncharacterized protein LOC108621750 n=1 Tax=Drosophila arizonae TaxID=7263 RepID=A0ABM1Q5J1_DROAR|nr:PREDICTED: uncharacterized protein LOC108621750 [Drosophila arizonae]